MRNRARDTNKVVVGRLVVDIATIGASLKRTRFFTESTRTVVVAQDNSRTRKEAVSYTYKGCDGYAPIAANLGNKGWCLGCVLHPSSQHPRNGTLNTHWSTGRS